MNLLLAMMGLALAAPPDLAAWAARTGLPLSIPAGGTVQQTPEGLALVGAGESMLLTDGAGPAALDAALTAASVRHARALSPLCSHAGALRPQTPRSPRAQAPPPLTRT